MRLYRDPDGEEGPDARPTLLACRRRCCRRRHHYNTFQSVYLLTFQFSYECVPNDDDDDDDDPKAQIFLPLFFCVTSSTLATTLTTHFVLFIGSGNYNNQLMVVSSLTFSSCKLKGIGSTYTGT